MNETPIGRHARRHNNTVIDSGEDLRSRFQQDRDRVLYSDALRRLDGVTQVASAHEGHVFHNRLTHTLKVAQLARRMAEHFEKATDPDLIDVVGGMDPEVAESAGLAHDLGHPPFGHIAEAVLDELVRKEGNHHGFEGNAQSFRIVTLLALRGSPPDGLDLTRATLRSILKYPWFREMDEQGEPLPRSQSRRPGGTNPFKKYGAYQTSEDADFLFAMDDESQGRKSAEAEIMDWADDITYAVHDVVDFYRAGLIPLDRLADDDGREWDFFLNDLEARHAGSPPISIVRAREERERITGYFPSRPYSGKRDVQREAVALSSSFINSLVSAIELQEPDGDFKKVINVTEEARFHVSVLKELTWTYVIQRPSLATQQHGQRQIVKNLFEVYNSQPNALIPDTYRDLPGGPARIAADIIAGMTEVEAVSMHRRLTGIDVGTVLDPIVGR